MHSKDYVSALFKKEGYWYYYTYVHNRRVFRSTGKKIKSQAQQVLVQRIESGDLLNTEARKKYMTLVEYAEQFWNYDTCPLVKDELARGGHCTRAYVSTNDKRVRIYVSPYYKNRYMDEITTSMVQDWLYWMRDDLGRTPPTCNQTLYMLRAVFKYAIQDGLADKNPTEGVRPLVNSNPKVRGCFTLEEVKKLFSLPWKHQHVKVMCMLAATTGMRLGEILALSPEQIHDGYILVDRSWGRKIDSVKSTKSGKSRVVPIVPEVQNMLEELPQQKFLFSYGNVPFENHMVSNHLKAQMELAGIDYKKENLTFHSFRHFFNTQLIGGSIKGEKIRSVIGHESEEMSMHYLHPESADMGDIKAIQEKILE